MRSVLLGFVAIGLLSHVSFPPQYKYIYLSAFCCSTSVWGALSRTALASWHPKLLRHETQWRSWHSPGTYTFNGSQADAFAPAGALPMLRSGSLRATSPLTPRMVVDDKTGRKLIQEHPVRRSCFSSRTLFHVCSYIISKSDTYVFRDWSRCCSVSFKPGLTCVLCHWQRCESTSTKRGSTDGAKSTVKVMR